MPQASAAPVGRRTLLGAVAAAGAVLLAGCAGPAPTGPRTPSPSSRPRATGPVADVAERMQRAADARDPDAFAALFAPGAAGQGRTIADNLTRLEGFSVRGEGSTLTVEWRGGPEGQAQVFTTDVALDAEGRLTSVGGTGSKGALPVWWLHPTDVLHGASSTIVVARPRAKAAQRWLEPADRAAAFLAQQDFGALRTDWDRRLLLVVPADVLDYGPAQVAAYAHPQTHGAGPSIWLNPKLLDQGDAEWLATLLVHEGVHAVANELVDVTPLWAEEGFAEMVAEDFSAGHRAANAKTVRAVVARRMPTDLPNDQALRQGADVLTQYALSAAAVRASMDRWGRPAVLELFTDAAALQARLPEMRTAYLEELSRRRGR